jgi:flagellin
MTAYHNLFNTIKRINKSIERLTTGERVNRAADDAAGFAIGTMMRARVEAFKQSSANAQDAISYLHSAEGGMIQIGEKLIRLRTLATQAATETYTSRDRLQIQEEVDNLIAEIDRIASSTDFNTHKPLTGEILDIHVGSGEDETLTITVTSVTVTALGISGLTVTGSCNTNAEDAITSLDAALSIKLGEQALLGSFENRLHGVITSIGEFMTNEASAKSRIKDLDFANQMMAYTRDQILQQTGAAMLAQSNAAPQMVLQLI